MKRIKPTQILLAIALVALAISCIQEKAPKAKVETPTADDATVWTFWHWVHGAVSKEGITADLESMKKQGDWWCLYFCDSRYGRFVRKSIGNLQP